MSAVSKDLFKMLLFRISIVAQDTRLDHLLRLYGLGMQCDSLPAIDAETCKLVHSVLFQCQGLISKYLQQLQHTDLQAILKYNAEFAPRPMQLSQLELLLVRFCNITADRDSIDQDLFLDLYLRFTEADIPNTTALADNFNIKLLNIVQADLKTLKTPVYSVTGSENHPLHSGEENRHFIGSLMDEHHPFRRAVNYTWAYLKNCHRSGKARFVEKNLAQDMVKVVNGMVVSRHADRQVSARRRSRPGR